MKLSQPKRGRQRRRGSLLLECVAGLVALGVALTLVGRVTHAIDRQWRLTTQERLAVETLDNAMEAACALGWDELSAERLAALPLPERVRDSLYRARLAAEIDSVASPMVSKRLRLVLAWNPTAEAEPRRRSLTTWVYPREAKQP